MAFTKLYLAWIALLTPSVGAIGRSEDEEAGLRHSLDVDDACLAQGLIMDSQECSLSLLQLRIAKKQKLREVPGEWRQADCSRGTWTVTLTSVSGVCDLKDQHGAQLCDGADFVFQALADACTEFRVITIPSCGPIDKKCEKEDCGQAGVLMVRTHSGTPVDAGTADTMLSCAASGGFEVTKSVFVKASLQPSDDWPAFTAQETKAAQLLQQMRDIAQQLEDQRAQDKDAQDKNSIARTLDGQRPIKESKQHAVSDLQVAQVRKQHSAMESDLGTGEANAAKLALMTEAVRGIRSHLHSHNSKVRVGYMAAELPTNDTAGGVQTAPELSKLQSDIVSLEASSARVGANVNKAQVQLEAYEEAHAEKVYDRANGSFVLLGHVQQPATDTVNHFSNNIKALESSAADVNEQLADSTSKLSSMVSEVAKGGNTTIGTSEVSPLAEKLLTLNGSSTGIKTKLEIEKVELESLSDVQVPTNTSIAADGTDEKAELQPPAPAVFTSLAANSCDDCNVTAGSPTEFPEHPAVRSIQDIQRELARLESKASDIDSQFADSAAKFQALLGNAKAGGTSDEAVQVIGRVGRDLEAMMSNSADAEATLAEDKSKLGRLADANEAGPQRTDDAADELSSGANASGEGEIRAREVASPEASATRVEEDAFYAPEKAGVGEKFSGLEPSATQVEQDALHVLKETGFGQELAGSEFSETPTKESALHAVRKPEAGTGAFAKAASVVTHKLADESAAGHASAPHAPIAAAAMADEGANATPGRDHVTVESHAAGALGAMAHHGAGGREADVAVDSHAEEAPGPERLQVHAADVVATFGEAEAQAGKPDVQLTKVEAMPKAGGSYSRHAHRSSVRSVRHEMGIAAAPNDLGKASADLAAVENSLSDAEAILTDMMTETISHGKSGGGVSPKVLGPLGNKIATLEENSQKVSADFQQEMVRMGTSVGLQELSEETKKEIEDLSADVKNVTVRISEVKATQATKAKAALANGTIISSSV